MEIIPVLDVLEKNAVHGKSGNRESYNPVKSVICESSDPVALANAYTNFGVKKIYIADLNAIIAKNVKNNKENSKFSQIDGEKNLKIIEKIESEKIVDFGISTIFDYEYYKSFDLKNTKLIIGTETLVDLELVNKTDVILSLDFKNGELLSKGYSFEELIKKLNENSKIPIIILDISSVGTLQGLNYPLIKKIIQNVKNPVYVGGGVKNIDDISKCKFLGVSGILIGTSLHNGTLNLKELVEKY
ncbi:phosphoribosylformimino-5-aminoimidazole carboxamide ribotide isomerase [Methanococcus voltae]|uniref:HisA/hisF family protein n=1 Tax=Methanococcus voltae (strain ATCC BAA-1334 / A3) TaxID=456320 RepID=D7DUW7_METV3|nr:phosphoribosylformimino-5-aminoimidazole carboxamide ribotide isomerase [Methanococcus voltae]